MELLKLVLACLFPWMNYLKENDKLGEGSNKVSSEKEEEISSLFDLEGGNSIIDVMTSNMKSLESKLTSLASRGMCCLCIKREDKYSKVIDGSILISVLTSKEYVGFAQKTLIQVEMIKSNKFCIECSKKIMLTRLNLEDSEILNGETESCFHDTSKEQNAAAKRASKSFGKRKASDNNECDGDVSSEIFKKSKWSLYYDSFNDDV